MSHLIKKKKNAELLLLICFVVLAEQMGGDLSASENESHERGSVTTLLEGVALLFQKIAACYNYANDSESGRGCNEWINVFAVVMGVVCVLKTARGRESERCERI